ncbi:MAG: hypothetical protein WC760_05745 [Bacteroidia bacterium]|jgi:hypothetical protein
MQIKHLLIATSTLLWMSCTNNTPPAPTSSPETEHHEHTDALQSIELDNGHKWKVDAPMMEYIRIMEKEVHASNLSAQKDYPALAKTLQTQVDGLTSNCTMTGKSHDELHKWLLPYIDLVKAFDEATGTPAEAEQHLKEIDASFDTFNQYFE